MSRSIRQPFSVKGEYVALRDFKIHGQKISQGDVFPWNELSISTHQLKRLYDSHLINIKSEDVVEDVEVDEETVDETEEVEDDETEEVEDEIEDDESEDDETEESDSLIFDPDVHRIDSPSRGEWFIYKGAEVVCRIERKEAKRLEKKTKRTEVKEERILGDQ